MRASTTHLPPPYEVAGHFIRTARGTRAADVLDGQMVAELDHRDPRCADTAAFIVRAVNSHEQLVAALRFYADRSEYEKFSRAESYSYGETSKLDDDRGEIARAALAAAEA